MKKQTATATAPASGSAGPIPDFIDDGVFESLEAPEKGETYLVIQGPEQMGPWRIHDGGTAVLYSGVRTRAGHQALDLGNAVVTQNFKAPVGRTVEITWMHSRNTDPECRGKTSQSYEAYVLDPTGTQVAADKYEPNSSVFSAIPAKQTLKFHVNSTGTYKLQFEGGSEQSCNALIWQVVGQAAGKS